MIKICCQYKMTYITYIFDNQIYIYIACVLCMWKDKSSKSTNLH